MSTARILGQDYPMAEREPGQALPNLVLAGVTKAATTSLTAYLAQHPQVFAPAVKELNYFSPLVHGLPPGDLAGYSRHFRTAADVRWRLDASPFYFVGGAAVAAAIAQTLERPRVLIILRDPVDRLWSSFRYKRSKGYLPSGQSFGQFFDECRRHYDQGTDLEREHARYLTLRTGRYCDFLPAWQDRFGPDLRIVFAQTLDAHPAQTMREVFRWLQIDTDVPVDLRRRNKTMQPRSVLARRIAYRVNQRFTPILANSPGVQNALKSGYDRLNSAGSTDTFQAADRALVEAFYAPGVAELAEQLTSYGYPELPSWLGAPRAAS